MPKHDDWGRDPKSRCITDMKDGYHETQGTAKAFKNAMVKWAMGERVKQRKRTYYQRRKLKLVC